MKYKLYLQKIKEERRCEAVADILRASCVGTSIKIKYLQGDDEIERVAVKRNEGKWIVLLNNNKQILVDPIDLQDPSKFAILPAPQNLSTVQKRNHGQSENQQRARNKALVKQDLHSNAAKLREERDLKFFESMLKQQADSKFGPKEFLLMAGLLHQPFSFDIDGRAVQIAESDCAMMLQKSIIEELTNNMLVDNQKQKKDEDDAGSIKKRLTGGHATINTVMGADCVTALTQTSHWDKTL
jgi:hypothetical protein